jgi:DNA-binding Xre family transcriptional regulator
MPSIRKRIRRPLTARELARHRRIIAATKRDQPGIAARGRAVLAAHDRLKQALQALKAKRQERGFSLADLQRISGIDRARLSRLESDPAANPTIETLDRIARALGVELRIAVVDSRAG